MQTIIERQRRASPFPKPQGLCVDGQTLWVSSRATRLLYSLDRSTFAVTWQTAVPDGTTPWGMTKAGEDLFVVCGTDVSEVDDRVIRRVRPGKGFDPEFRWPCPEGIGSHLSHTGNSLVLSQWYAQKLVVFDRSGKPVQSYNTGRCVVGHCFANGVFYLVTIEGEGGDEKYWLTRLDPATKRTEDLASIGFAARALAFDGTHFWSNHREADEIVCFSV
jgi:hypothetical protein